MELQQTVAHHPSQIPAPRALNHRLGRSHLSQETVVKCRRLVLRLPHIPQHQMRHQQALDFGGERTSGLLHLCNSSGRRRPEARAVPTAGHSK